MPEGSDRHAQSLIVKKQKFRFPVNRQGREVLMGGKGVPLKAQPVRLPQMLRAGKDRQSDIRKLGLALLTAPLSPERGCAVHAGPPASPPDSAVAG